MDSLGAVYKTILIIVLACMGWIFIQFHVEAAELNTKLPAEQDAEFSVPISVDIPSQPLAAALNQLGKSTNLNIAFPSDLVLGKTAPAVKGRMSRKEALQRILANSGLAARIEDGNAYIAKATNGDKNIQLDQINVRAKRFYEVGPLPGLGLTKDQIPGNVQSITAKEIKESHSLSLTDLMNKKLQSVTVNDYQGNPFQMDVQYRGFTAGPQIGTPQGLSVFFDGIRVNEPFGDVVNWDMIPMNAIAGVDVFPGSNPIFGLNTLGGAFTLKTKDGFNNEGVDAEVLYGSFNRKQLQLEGGWNNGTIALFGAGNFFLEDGWRENSPSKVNQFFGKASYRGDKLDINLSTLWVGTDLVGNGLLPSEEYGRDRNSVFTSPDTTKNRLQQFQLSGSYFVTDGFSVTGQVYRRNSNRTQKGADAFTGFDNQLAARRRPNPGEEYTCLFSSTNDYGIPDYYVVPVNQTAGESIFGTDFINDYFANGKVLTAADGLPVNYDGFKNVAITDANFLSTFKQMFEFYKNPAEAGVYNRDNPAPISEGALITDPFGSEVPTYRAGSFTLPAANFGGAFFPGTDNVLITSAFTNDIYFYTTAGNGDLIQNHVILTIPSNLDACNAARATNALATDEPAGNAYTYTDSDGYPVFVDGAGAGTKPDGTGFPGVVEGTPTAIITNNEIEQIVDGASVQLNWNLEHHKFMVGASIDAASADYRNVSQLGFLDGNRNAYLDPAQANPQFIGALEPIANNNFDGTNTTKSIYFSETWSPTDTIHINTSGRYNQTKTKNKIAARYGLGTFQIGDLIAVPDNYNICTDVDGDGDVDATDCAGVPVNYRKARILNTLDKPETEKFSFYSFNPSLGGTWQAKENLNVYANWAKGTRTPSVVELGCAFDDTPVPGIGGAIGPRSIVENRFCSLPTTLSGDPFLPQIKATSYDIGVRGNISENLQWNFGAYQTDLKDDIYFIAVGNGQGFFDSIGKTRRRGIEAGLSGRKDKWGFSLNYALTDATFEEDFLMLNEDNSSAFFVNGFGNVIQVKKGSRMPGVSLHNLNASVSYEVTPQWKVGLTAVAHAESFVRGNENNKHKQGVAVIDRIDPVGIPTYRLPTGNPGTVPGYATFNFQTSYKFAPEWTATLLVNNIFDKEYFSAGRLGRNPFSPSINGAIGPDGYNHNSNDWASTNFIAPGAPRGIWFSLNYQFVPDKQ